MRALVSLLSAIALVGPLAGCGGEPRSPQAVVGLYLQGIKGQDPMRSLSLLTPAYHLRHGMVFANTVTLPDGIELPERAPGEADDEAFAIERGRLGWLVAPSQMGPAHVMFPRLKEVQLAWLGERVDGDRALVGLRAWEPDAASADLLFRLVRSGAQAPWRIDAVDVSTDGSREARFIAYVIAPDIEAVRFIRAEALRWAQERGG